jgi:hypothetical protein
MGGYYILCEGAPRRAATLPAAARPLADVGRRLLPPAISQVHEAFCAWRLAGYSAGAALPDRFALTPAGELYLRFDTTPPQSPGFFAAAQELAGWLVLLDKWMETFVVIARARAVWPVAELAAALPFTAPVYLPPPLLALPPQNWGRVALALATAVADGPLKGAAGRRDRHWQGR